MWILTQKCREIKKPYLNSKIRYNDTNTHTNNRGPTYDDFFVRGSKKSSFKLVPTPILSYLSYYKVL